MPRYSLAELIDRANSGNIGRRGLRRLMQERDSLAGSGVDLAALTHNVDADLGARRAALYANAVQAAHDLPEGQTLSAGIQRRLQLGAGGPMSQNTFTPRDAAGVKEFTAGDNYPAILESLRKRAQGIGSNAPIYGKWR